MDAFLLFTGIVRSFLADWRGFGLYSANCTGLYEKLAMMKKYECIISLFFIFTKKR